MEMEMEMNRGFTDRAAEKDSFGIEGYVTGLSKFIYTCNTPMTVGIQGDWGTGKTSIMKMINKKLDEKGTSEMIWFNTWQFSQFSMGNDLAISLISCLLGELEVEDASSDKIKKFIGHVGNFAKNMTVMMVDSKLGGAASENVAKALNGKDEKYDMPTAIKGLKGDFEACVKSTLVAKKKERLVIFVDDLDRLQPAKAIELLEVLKLFLDCENCVFVLAIDYAVVLRGVAEKYGASIGEDKGKSFFDKIIQVPFKMPVASYDITNYVKECFEEIGIKVGSNKGDLDAYVSLIRSTIGYNPRSMKRMFNAFLLLSNIASDELLTIDKNKQMLFAILCLQQSNEKMYDYIVSSRNIINAEWMNRFNDRDNVEIRKYMADKGMQEKDQTESFDFMIEFNSLMDADGNEELEPAEIESFKRVLNFSTITSADSSVERRKGERQEVNTLEALVAVTHTDEKIQLLYKKYAEKIRELAGGESVEEKYFVGQSSVSFYIKTKSGKSRKLCEIKLNKKALTLFLVQKTTQELIDKIEMIHPGLTNHIGDPNSQINGIVNEEKMDEILTLIQANYNLIYSELNK